MTQSLVPAAQPLGAFGGPARLMAGVSAGTLWSAGLLLPNILAVIFQATQQSRGIDESELGTLGAAFLLGRGLVIATAPFWIYRANPRRVTAASICATVGALLALAFLIRADQLSYGWFVVGLTSACVATPGYTALGGARDPLRAYSIALFAGSLLAAVVAYVLPVMVVPHYGERGTLILIAALFFACLPFAPWLHDDQFGGRQTRAAGVATPRQSRRLRRLVAPITAAIAGAVFTGVFMGGAGAFVASIAATRGIAPEAVGLFVAFALIASLIGTVVPSVVGHRASPAAMVGVATGGIILSYLAMSSASPVIFGAGYVIHAIFATIGYVYFLGIVRELDFTARIYVAYPAIDAAAYAASAELSGQLLSRSTPTVLFLISAAALSLCWLAVWAATIAAKRGEGYPADLVR